MDQQRLHGDGANLIRVRQIDEFIDALQLLKWKEKLPMARRQAKCGCPAVEDHEHVWKRS